ncbi:MAG: MFS transporter [Anaerolineae bacterium]|nr:MFS transporter [Anaerolineae bacterium]
MVADYIHALRGFSRDVRLYLFTAALLGFTAFGGIYPVLFNLYLLRLGYGPDFVGTINAIGGLAFALFSLPAGVLSARWGGRRTMIAGLALAILAFAGLPIGEFVPAGLRAVWLSGAYLLRAVGFAMYWVNARPFLISATDIEARSHVYSVQSAIMPLTGFAGSLIAGLLPGAFAALLSVSLEHPAPYRYPLWSVALMLLPGLIALKSMGEFSAGQKRHQERPRGKAPLGPILLLSLCILLQSTGLNASVAFFNVYLDDGLSVSTKMIGAISAVTQLISALASLSLPVLAQRWSKARVFLWSSIGVAASMLPLALVPHWGTAALSYLGLTVLNSIAFPTINLYQMERVGAQWRMTMSGMTSMANGLNYSVTSFLGGYIVASWGYRPFFLSGAALTLVGALLFWMTSGSGDETPVTDETNG